MCVPWKSDCGSGTEAPHDHDHSARIAGDGGAAKCVAGDGDVKPYFDDGKIQIWHGDCRDVIPDLDPVDVVITDPPYAIGGSRAEWKVTASVGTGIHLAARKIKKGGAALVFTTTSGRGIEFTMGAVGSALPFNRLLVWHKTFVRSRVAGPWRWDAVAILAFGRASFGRPEHSSVFTSTGPASNGHLGSTGHPAELPEGISEWLYAPFGAGDAVMLDPFMGSGRLLDAAVRRGQKCIGIEIEERYCEIAVKRLQQSVLPLEVV
jgi:hypothetical protein